MAEDTIRCVRCHETAPAASNASWGGALGDEIRAKVCQSCWAEWQEAEVMVINELRLNFMEPGAQETLIQHMREFLMLDDGAD
jgi:Fe-S cluster biosynthesis and repair protein YggX